MESNVNNMFATVVAAIAATVADFYAHLAPWLLFGAILVIVDLRFGIQAARARGEEIRPSRAWRRTINKAMDYLCWVTVAEMCSRTFAPAIGVPVVSLGMLIVIYGIELSSCINNYFEYKHVDRRISIFKLLKGTKWGNILEKSEESRVKGEEAGGSGERGGGGGREVELTTSQSNDMIRKTEIDTIMIHCTATPAGREVSRRELDSWHKAEGFEPYIDPKTGAKTYAGYHLLVHLDGSYERLRPDAHRGQHCPQDNMNNRAVAICYVGGCDINNKPCDTRTEAQKKTLVTLVRTMRGRYPGARIIGHRDVKGVRKACPSFDAKREYKVI